jgi:UDP-glucose 4-epimerase
MSSVLVTGSEGCIGPYLVAALHRHLPSLRVIRLRRGGDPTDGDREAVAVGNLNDDAFVRSLFAREDIRFVIHAAGTRYSAAVFQERPFDLFDNDLGALLALLRHGAQLEKFVFLSSATIYERVGVTPMPEEATESWPPPVSPFGISKGAAERMIAFFSRQTKVPHTIWRLFNIVSPLESPQSSSGHVFIDFFRKIYLERQPVLEIKGDGKQSRCFTWVEDVASAIAVALLDARSNDQIFNLGHEVPHSMMQLAETLLAIGHRKAYLPAAYSPEITTGGTFFGVDSQNRVPDVRKVRETLGIDCPTTFESTFERFVDRMMNHEQH